MWEVDECMFFFSSAHNTAQQSTNNVNYPWNIARIQLGGILSNIENCLAVDTHSTRLPKNIEKNAFVAGCMHVLRLFSFIFSHCVDCSFSFWEICSCTIRTLIWKLYNLKWRRRKKSRKWRKKKIVKMLGDTHHDSCGCRSTLLVAAVLARQF